MNRPASPPRPATGGAAAPVDAERILLELRGLRERVEALAPADAPLVLVGELETMRQSLVERLDGFDLAQARLDAAISRMEGRALGDVHGRRGDRGLRVVVALLAAVSVASLVLGLYSLSS